MLGARMRRIFSADLMQSVPNQLNRPTLRKAPGSGTSGDGKDGKDKGADDDDRPTLKRRPDQFR